MAQPAEPSPQELRALAELLRDPAIQTWLQAQAEGAPAAAPEVAANEGAAAHQMMAGRIDAMRAFLRELAAAVPTLPDELRHASTTFAAERQSHGAPRLMALLAVFAALGFGLEWLFWWATTGFRQRLIAAGVGTVRERVRAIGMRAAYGLGVLLAFAVGSIGAFLLFEWPPLLKQIVIAYLLVFLIVRLVLVLGRILLAPAPSASGSSRWRRLRRVSGSSGRRSWSAGSSSRGSRSTCSPCSGSADPPSIWWGSPAAWFWSGSRSTWYGGTRRDRATSRRAASIGASLLSVYVVVAWLLLFTGTATLFYVGVILLLLALALRSVHLAVSHVLRPEGSATAEPVPSLTAVTVERGLRAALLIGGAYLIAWVLDLDGGHEHARHHGDAPVRGAINAVVILLIADLAWHLARAWIDCKLVEAHAAEGPDAEEARRRARLRTLLPILKNVLLVVLIVMAVLMALAALGIEVGPLIAGAGVVGVAVGLAPRPWSRTSSPGCSICWTTRSGLASTSSAATTRARSSRSRCARSSFATTAAISIPCRSGSWARSRT